MLKNISVTAVKQTPEDHTPSHRALEQDPQVEIINHDSLKRIKTLRTLSELKDASVTKLPAIGHNYGMQYSSVSHDQEESIDVDAKKGKKPEPTVHNIWIVKPGENTNRGNGIKVCSTLNEIKDIFTANMYDFHHRTFILQKYIERP